MIPFVSGFWPTQASTVEASILTQGAEEEATKDADPQPRRIRTGCKSCRRRRVKCGGGPGDCLNCRKRKLECEYDVVTVSKRATSCAACRISKAKCSRDLPACSRCTKKLVTCTYDNVKPLGDEEVVYSATSTRSPLSVPVASESWLSQSVIEQHIEAFFTFCYPNQVNAFLRRPQVIRGAKDGSIQPLLAKAICMISARFLVPQTSHPEGGDHVANWSTEIRMHILNSFNQFSTTTLAIVLLLIQHEYNSGIYGSSWVMVALASRIAFGLNLRVESGSSWAEAEYRRRLMWAVFYWDSYAGAGLAEYITCPLEKISLPLPSNDRNFGLSIPVYSQSFDLDTHRPQTGCDGILSRLVWIMSIRARIISFVKNPLTSLRPWEEGSSYQAAIEALAHWLATLPPELALTADNIHARDTTNQLGGFIALHLWHAQLHCDLYRLAMPDLAESAPPSYFDDAPPSWKTDARALCFVYAQQIGQILSLVRDAIPTFVPHDMFFPIFVYESCRNQIQYLKSIGETIQTDNGTRIFEEMMSMVRAMIAVFPTARNLLFEIHGLFFQSGVVLNFAWEDCSPITTIGPHALQHGTILSQMHPLRWHQPDS
ncbi:hypothetical protein BD324DRAFT_624213 [Kockovaella imperatae]|uniref:Zn(2)-C6 fungal-type domain-containing protein n=1 Tax=Kockovaella imperatae TaxID=4999 RepID=A0A1Y1UKI3_9TREE|nr:hypothetical protein BD324DRAFT_624213 [Kockovaella imperatae]ORX38014.1 hypothetical protein BD324DRAFT_624213 [Kockovaella imperatae]